MKNALVIWLLFCSGAFAAGWDEAAWSNEYPSRAVYQNIYSAAVERAMAAGILTASTGFPLRAPAVVLHSIVPSNTVTITNWYGTNAVVVSWTNWTLNLVPWTNTDWQTDFYKSIGGQGYGTYFTIEYPSAAYLKAIWDLVVNCAVKYSLTGTNDATDLDEWLRSYKPWTWRGVCSMNPEQPGGWIEAPQQRTYQDLPVPSFQNLAAECKVGANLQTYTATTNATTYYTFGHALNPPNLCLYRATSVSFGVTSYYDNYQLTLVPTSSAPMSWWLGGSRVMVKSTFSTTSAVAGVTNITRYNVCGWSNFYGVAVPHTQMQLKDWPAVKMVSSCQLAQDVPSVSVRVIGPHSRRDAVLGGAGGVSSEVAAVTWGTTQTLSKLYYALSVVSTQGVVGAPCYTNVVGEPSMLGSAIDYFAASSNMALYGSSAYIGGLHKATLVELRTLLNNMRIVASDPPSGITTGRDVSVGLAECNPPEGVDVCAYLRDCADNNMRPVTNQANRFIDKKISYYLCEFRYEVWKTVSGKRYLNVVGAVTNGWIDVYFMVAPVSGEGTPELVDTGYIASEKIPSYYPLVFPLRKQVSFPITGSQSLISWGTDTTIEWSTEMGYYHGYITALPGQLRTPTIVVVRPAFIYTDDAE